jgi:hypothetical protein
MTSSVEYFELKSLQEIKEAFERGMKEHNLMLVKQLENDKKSVVNFQ